MKIALIAHDKKKGEIIELAKKYKDALGNAIQHMRGGQISDRGAFPPFMLNEIIVQHTKYLISINISAVFVNNTQTVAVAIHSNTDIIASLNHPVTQTIAVFSLLYHILTRT